LKALKGFQNDRRKGCRENKIFKKEEGRSNPPHNPYYLMQ